MGFDGLDADIKLLGDLTVPLLQANSLEDFSLPFAQLEGSRTQ